MEKHPKLRNFNRIMLPAALFSVLFFSATACSQDSTVTATPTINPDKLTQVLLPTSTVVSTPTIKANPNTPLPTTMPSYTIMDTFIQYGYQLRCIDPKSLEFYTPPVSVEPKQPDKTGLYVKAYLRAGTTPIDCIPKYVGSDTQYLTPTHN